MNPSGRGTQAVRLGLSRFPLPGSVFESLLSTPLPIQLLTLLGHHRLAITAVFPLPLQVALVAAQ